MTGIEPAEETIGVARKHKERDPQLRDSLEYHCTTIEDHNKAGNEGKYDLVTSFEVIEHIENPELFVSELAKSLKPNGLLFLSTMEKNFQAYFSTIFMAEKVLRIVEDGTHNYEKFINYEDLKRIAELAGLESLSHQTAFYDPITGQFFYTPHINAHYLTCFRK